MCMRNTEEGCILQEQQAELAEKVANIDTRLTKVEGDMSEMRSETQNGFKQGAAAMRQINTALDNLAHDFGDRMNTIDKRLVAEKEKWGETLRKVVLWSVRVILLGACVAMGVTAYVNMFK